MTRTFALVGGGLAGAKAAQTLRSEGFDGRVVLIGEEPHRPYERPPLSKGYLRGEDGLDKVFVHDEDFAQAQDVEVWTDTRVDALDLDNRRLVLPRNVTLPFDALLLATGSQPRRLPIPGAELDGVHVLRTLEDSRRLRHALQGAATVAVVGAGWIGCEVAASARQMGKDVTLIDPLATPLFRVLGEQVGAVFAALHEDHGVVMRLGVGVEKLVGASSVEAVVLSDGTRVDADVVVLGVGVTPRVELAKAAGLAVADGVLADELLETNAPGVFVAGDIAEASHPFLRRRIRVEHWANALNQGAHAARNMLGAGEAYERLPYFYSDQYDLGMEYVGHADRWDDVVFRGDVQGRQFVAFYRRDERVVAALAVNVRDAAEALKALITSRVQTPVEAVRDAATDLTDLAVMPANG